MKEEMNNEIVDNKTETIPIKKLSVEELQFQKLMQFASLAKHAKKDLNSNIQVQNTFSKKFNKDDVMKWMANPSKYVKKLRDLSRFLYDTSSHYKRLIQYFATMLTFDYFIEPYGMIDLEPTPELIELSNKKYINIVNLIEVMNIKHEFLKVCERAWIDDVAYLYEYKTNDSYFLDFLNPDYCEINGTDDGCNTFCFNFQYFDTYPEELKRFDAEFTEKYDLYKTDKKKYKWQELNPSKTMCIKINESLNYPIPPFCGIFEEIYSLEDYKNLKLSKTELENYLLLVATLPYRDNATDENAFALSIDKALEYFSKMADNLPDQVGAIFSPFESIEAVKVDKNDKDTDKVSEAQKSLYDSAGVSQLLFNGGSNAATVTKSIIVDENVVFKVLRQFERWLNRKLKDENKRIKYRANFLDITDFNRADYIKNLKEGATLGTPNKLKYAAALGQSPSSNLHMEFLENSVLKLSDKWKPLSSSYTQSGDQGRPTNEEDDLTESGEKTRSNDTNNRDARD